MPNTNNPKKVIIIGATSGIGEALAKEYALQKYELGLTGRRTERLEVLQKTLSTTVHIQTMDVAQNDLARQQLTDLIERMGGLDLIVINAGIGRLSTEWEDESLMINVNVTGFAAIANAAFDYFQSQQRQGHIVGISSVAAVRGNSGIPSYAATKSFVSSYMQGLRYHAQKRKLDIHITDIRPGFVETPMTAQNEGMFWVSTVDKAARQIVAATAKRRKVAYITKRWRIMAWLMRWMPDFLYLKVGG